MTHEIRSFMPRLGRITPGQQFALDNYWSLYGLNPDIIFDSCIAFGRTAPTIVEIGFGNGDSLAQTAKQNSHINYVGIEVHRAGVGHLMMCLHEEKISNVRIYCHDALVILKNVIPDESLTGVHLFFPDPWHKKKHHKRRIVRDSFIALLNKKLAKKGYFHAATDWEEYAQAMLEILSKNEQMENCSEDKTYCERPDYRPLTKFEKRGLRLGHGVWDLIFKKII